MTTRPEDSIPLSEMEKSRKATKALEDLGRNQLSQTAARERVALADMRRQLKSDEEGVVRGAGRAFAGAMGRRAGGMQSISGLGTLQADTNQRRMDVRSQGAANILGQERKLGQAEQELTRFNLEAMRKPEDIQAGLDAVDTELARIAKTAGADEWYGEDENMMADLIEQWARTTNPTVSEWNRMTSNAYADYGVGSNQRGNRRFKTPIVRDGRVVGFQGAVDDAPRNERGEKTWGTGM